MPFQIVHNDIVRMKTDAIVNAANSALLAGSGVCGAIFRAAGYEKLSAECHKKAPCPVGQSVLTSAYNLPARYIIHTVGPVWQGGKAWEKDYLTSCYTTALKTAWEAGCRSISFPLISAGIFGYPLEEASETACQSIRAFLQNHEMEVYLVVLERPAIQLNHHLADELKQYLNQFLGEEKEQEPDEICICHRESDVRMSQDYGMDTFARPVKKDRHSLNQILQNLDETFSHMVLRLIDEKGYSDIEVYTRANMDRRLFSKIRSHEEYLPKKKTVLALAVGLRLSVTETEELLHKAGYSLSGSKKRDVIVRYFLDHGEYDIYTIDKALFYFGEPEL